MTWAGAAPRSDRSLRGRLGGRGRRRRGRARSSRGSPWPRSGSGATRSRSGSTRRPSSPRATFPSSTSAGPSPTPGVRRGARPLHAIARPRAPESLPELRAQLLVHRGIVERSARAVGGGPRRLPPRARRSTRDIPSRWSAWRSRRRAGRDRGGRARRSRAPPVSPSGLATRSGRSARPSPMCRRQAGPRRALGLALGAFQAARRARAAERDLARDPRPASALAGQRARWLAPLLVAAVTAAAFLPALERLRQLGRPRTFLDNPHYRGLGPAAARVDVHDALMGPLHAAHLDHARRSTTLLWEMKPVRVPPDEPRSPRRDGVGPLLPRHQAAASGPPARLRRLGTADRGRHGRLLFAVHPLRAESVAWVTERRDVLSGFLFVRGARLREGGRFGAGLRRGWYRGALALFLGAFSRSRSRPPSPSCSWSWTLSPSPAGRGGRLACP